MMPYFFGPQTWPFFKNLWLQLVRMEQVNCWNLQWIIQVRVKTLYSANSDRYWVVLMGTELNLLDILGKNEPFSASGFSFIHLNKNSTSYLWGSLYCWDVRCSLWLAVIVSISSDRWGCEDDRRTSLFHHRDIQPRRNDSFHDRPHSATAFKTSGCFPLFIPSKTLTYGFFI